MRRLVFSFVRDDKGTTFVEYGLILALVALVAISAVQMLGHSVNALFKIPPPNSPGSGGF